MANQLEFTRNEPSAESLPLGLGSSAPAWTSGFFSDSKKSKIGLFNAEGGLLKNNFIYTYHQPELVQVLVVLPCFLKRRGGG